MIAIKARLVSNMGERAVLRGFELTFKCQQHVSLAAYNRTRATVLSAVTFLDGTPLWQHAPVCLLVFMSLQVECADERLRRREYEAVE